MIRFFIKAGDEEIGSRFRQYIFGDQGISKFIGSRFARFENEHLSLYLFMYYVEGRFDVNCPGDMKLQPYSKRDKSLSISFLVNNSNFWSCNDQGRRKFLTATIENGFALARARLKKNKIVLPWDEIGAEFDNIKIDYEKY